MNNRMIYQVDETRKKILKTAEILFTDNGFFETQMKDIAEKTGISRNSVYRYFQNKSDLAMAIIEIKIANKQEFFRKEILSVNEDDSISGLEKFEKIISLNWVDREMSMESKLMAEFDAYYSGNRITPDIKERLLKLESEEYENLLVNVIDEGKRDGSINPNTDSHLTLVTVINSIRALNQRTILRGDVLVETRKYEIDRMLPLLLKLIIDGLDNKRSSK